MTKISPSKTKVDKLKILETFENSYPDRDYVIVHKTSEFTSICPRTGQPDFGTITISYIANKLCVELRSLKFYLQSYRNEGIFYENVTNKILEDLAKVLKPKWMEVKGEFSVRGGLWSTVIASHGKRQH
jgi:7-cyano-7-deazaguanine reductase